MTGVSTLGQALNRINLLQDQNTLLDSLTNQLSTRKKTQKYSGLGNDILTSKRTRADLNAVDAYINNIQNADRRMQLMSNSIEEFQVQSQNLWELMIGFGQESLHEANADIIYGLQNVDGNQALNGFGSIPALVAANAPDLDDPNDSFEITFSDPDDPQNAIEITVDISDAAAAAGGGDAQVELVNYINGLIAAEPAVAELNAQAVALGTGEISLQGTANISISSSNISIAGLGALGFAEGTYGLGPEHEIGLSSDTLDVELSTIKDAATKIYDFLIELLNQDDSGRYLFGGADTSNQPITDTGALDAKISSMLNSWQAGTLTNTELLSGYKARTVADDPNAITDTTVGYSAALSSGNAGEVYVRIKEQSEIEYTTLANDSAFRDILVLTAFIKSDEFGPIADSYDEPYTPGDLPVTQGAPGATLSEMKDNFFAMFNDMTTTMNRAIDSTERSRFSLEGSRARIDSVHQSYIQERALYQSTIEDVEGVDLNEVAVKIQALQVQLQASYTVTASVSELSLVNFI